MSFLVNAVLDFGSWVQESLFNVFGWISDTINNFIQWMLNTFQQYIVNPIQSGFNLLILRFIERIDRVLFVSFILPLEFNYIKQFVQKPSEDGLMKIIFTPLLGYIGGSIFKEILKGWLGSGEGIAIPELPTVPNIPSVPELGERMVIFSSGVSVSDNLLILLYERYINILTSDIITIDDSLIVNFPEIKIGISDFTNIYDSYSIEVETNIIILDSTIIQDNVLIKQYFVESITATTSAVMPYSISEPITAITSTVMPYSINEPITAIGKAGYLINVSDGVLINDSVQVTIT